jgi:hypothetical protein
VFGRVRRAAASLPTEDDVRACALLHVYSPEVIATALVVAMGVHAASGSTATKSWGRREQNRYLRFPGRVLVLVTSNALIVREWTLTKGMGRELARWPAGSFTATRVRHTGQIGVRVALSSGKVAVMTGRKGWSHPSVRATVDAIISAGKPSSG